MNHTRDPRLTPANNRVADIGLRGQVTANSFVQGQPARVTHSIVDLCPLPGTPRHRQLIFGDQVTVYEHHDGLAFVQAKKDGYVGYADAAGLQLTTVEPTHFVATAGSHLYQDESFKSPDIMPVTFGSRITVLAERQKMFETDQGYIPKKHLRPLDRPFSDPAMVAQLFFGTAYLWGGNSGWGIDCSGLIQAALRACGMDCPGDSDQQCEALGTALPEAQSSRRSDLYFWQGHVGILVDPDTLLHANAHHMSCVYEPLNKAIARIDAQGDGPVLARKRFL